MSEHRPGKGAKRRPPLTRSEVMSRVRGKDTAPEMRVRRTFWAAGLRYRLYDKRLPGKPDIVFASRRTVVFVHGCFWHAHDGCPRHRIPKTRADWWGAKIARNVERDARVRHALKAAGWTVFVIWECETENPSKVQALAQAIIGIARQRGARHPNERLSSGELS